MLVVIAIVVVVVAIFRCLQELRRAGFAMDPDKYREDKAYRAGVQTLQAIECRSSWRRRSLENWNRT